MNAECSDGISSMQQWKGTTSKRAEEVGGDTKAGVRFPSARPFWTDVTGQSATNTTGSYPKTL